MFEFVRVRIFGGSGGLLHDAIPIYGSQKAPYGSHYPLSKKDTNPFFVGNDDDPEWLHIRNDFICGAKYDFETGSFEVNDRGYTQLYELRGDKFVVWNSGSSYPYAEATHLFVLDSDDDDDDDDNGNPPPKECDCDGMYRVRIARLFPLEVHLERIDVG